MGALLEAPVTWIDLVPVPASAIGVGVIDRSGKPEHRGLTTVMGYDSPFQRNLSANGFKHHQVAIGKPCAQPR